MFDFEPFVLFLFGQGNFSGDIRSMMQIIKKPFTKTIYFWPNSEWISLISTPVYVNFSNNNIKYYYSSNDSTGVEIQFNKRFTTYYYLAIEAL